MEITTYKQAAAYINEYYASPKLREFIFGLEEVSFRDIKGIGAINKVLTAEFLIVYFSWASLDRNAMRPYRSKHFDLASEVMRGLYKGQRFGLDAMIYVLTEGKKDIAENGERSFFYPFIDTTDPCELGRIYCLIDEWRNDLQTSETLVDVVLGHFISVIKMAKALRTADVISEKGINGSETSFIFDGKTLRTRDIVYVDEQGSRFVLLDVGYEKDEALCHYMAIDDFSLVTVIKKVNRR